MDILSLPIEKTGLSNRAVNALKRNHICTVGDMLVCTEEQLFCMRNLGAKSVNEILQMTEKYKDPEFVEKAFSADRTDEEPGEIADAAAWVKSDEARDAIPELLKEKTIDELELLSPRAYNMLRFSGYTELGKIIFLTEEELTEALPRMDERTAHEIAAMAGHYLKEHADEIAGEYLSGKRKATERELTTKEKLAMPEYRETVTAFVKANDKEIEKSGLSVRARNCLMRENYKMLSEIVFLSREKLLGIKSMGNGTADEILAFIEEYLEKNEKRITAVINGDQESLLPDEEVEERILAGYKKIGFRGMAFDEIAQQEGLKDAVNEERLKKSIGKLIAGGELEYVDGKCYRVYSRFSEVLDECTEIEERNREFITRRLKGDTLETIAGDHELTRERVRQIVNKTISKVTAWYGKKTGKEYFDEDYYRYLYCTYDFDRKDGTKWLGIPEYVFKYMDMVNAEQGKKDLHEAIEDTANIYAGMRLKIKNYLNRNRIFADGVWIERNRAAIEEHVAARYCRDEVAFDEFAEIYNDFLKRQEIEYDEKIYYTEAIRRTRVNRLSEARNILWKYGERLRYYDVDSRDYEALLDELGLEAFENIEISTLKLMNEHGDLLKKYDIRDQYELYSLLKKIVPEGSYHNIHCDRMPYLRFGEPDREKAIAELIRENAPISKNEITEIIYQKHGYDKAIIQGYYLRPFEVYYHKEQYNFDQKEMPEENAERLKALLTEEFYYFDEIRKIYTENIPDADPEEVNAYNLKKMGYTVLSNYILNGYNSLEIYFREMFTEKEITDITQMKKRYGSVQMFRQTLNEMERDLEIVEFEPNQFISREKLTASGVSRESIFEFCDAVYEFANKEKYFSIQALRRAGFASELFELGFSDLFYSSLLKTDERLSYERVFNNYIFCKGKEEITIQSFLVWMIEKAESIDTFDLMNELTNEYGCTLADKYDILYRCQGCGVYYDKILDRFYADEDTFYYELEQAEGMRYGN